MGEDVFINGWWVAYFPQRPLHSLEHTEHNYWMLALSLKERGWTDHAVAGVLGNIQYESACNPGSWEYCAEVEHQDYQGSCGYVPGAYLFAWTPWSKYYNWVVANGKEEYDGCAQLEFLFETIEQDWNLYDAYGLGGNYFPNWQDFANSSEYSLEKYALGWCSYYEKPSEDPSVNHVAERIIATEEWYKRITTESPPPDVVACSGTSGCVYKPRLTASGIEGSKYWYSNTNPFFQAGFGLPNCTCYAWGRWWELWEQNGIKDLPQLPTSDGGQWFSDNSIYTESQEPSLGAVACFEDLNGGAGHVAIVEKLSENGNITLSNSAYGGDLFLLSEMNVKDGIMWGHFKLQGFIVNPHACSSTPRPPAKKKKRKIIWYLKKRRYL